MIRVLLFLIFTQFVIASDLKAPKWIFQSGDERYIYGVGSAKKMDSLAKQLRIASILARANLSENIGVEIESKFTKEHTQKGKEMNYSISQTSSHLLRYAFIKDRWISKNGELFILMAIDRGDIR